MSKALGEYRRKRDFSKTGEPAGEAVGGQGNRFVIHKHSATADHYDLRLQVGDTLKCWAVPKGPSINPADKRLAVETEDHPVEYAEFEGVIPKGQYGAGPMIIWDAGTWAPMDDIDASLAKGQFKFRLVGQKLRGGWMLTRLKPRPGDRQNNWLLFKEQDFAADENVDILAERPESVKSGRAIEDLAARPVRNTAKPRPGALPGVLRATLPDKVEPQLATSAPMPPEGGNWLHEIKFDGYRTIARIENGEVRLHTRSGLDWTARYGDLADAIGKIPCRSAMIDGEVVVLNSSGVSNFAELQDALSNGLRRAFVFFAFDLLHLNGWDLRKVPLARRKDTLERLLAPVLGEQSAVQYSDHVAGKGRAFFDRATELGLEGVVSKRADAEYRSGRTQTWLKAKALRTGNFAILGYTVSEAAGGLAALAVGEWEGDDLRYRGKVGTGFDSDGAASLLKRLEGLRDDVELPEGAPKSVIPVRPVLTAQIHYATRTASGALRHPVYKGLREAQLSAATSADRTRYISDADLAAIWVTNPTRRVFGKSGPTKLDIAVYYAGVGDFMLPHLLGRPVSLVRCPTGRIEDCFYQRHAFTGMPDTVGRFKAESADEGEKEYLSIETAKGYLALAQFGVIEFHSWGSLRKKLDRPDRVIFDLDPGEGIEWRDTVEAAVHVRDKLIAMGLSPFVKTSGGKGLHVVVPILPKLAYKTIHRRTGQIAEAIAATASDTFVTTMSKKLRKKRIFIDFHRNVRGATAVSPYSLRARPNLPVSTPLDWQALETVDGPADFNYSTVPELLAVSGDPWADMEASAKALPQP